jgi:cell division septation protein DedD
LICSASARLIGCRVIAMRFEVKTGGIIAILLGLTALSGAVFLMGLRAGYDIARENQTDADKVATDYPLTVAPPSSAAPGLGAQAPAASETSGLVEGPVPAAPEAVTRKPVPAVAGPALASNPKPSRVIEAPAGLPPPAAPSAEEPETATAPAPVHNVRKPFNIEIQAAMDATSAGQMLKRLQALGYQPHVVPTQLNGATWYKVEVGPYATQADAATAEAELRQKYNGTYGHGGAPAQSADTDQSPEE